MSKYSQGYMGPQIGKLGPAVGRRWRGKNVMVAYQEFVRNPKSLDQQKVRARFAKLTHMTTMFREICNIGFAAASQGTTMDGANLFVKRNWSNTSAVTPDEVTVNYSQLKLSEGALPTPSFGAPDFNTEGQVDVTWTANLGPLFAGSDDKVYIFVYQPDTNQCVMTYPYKREALAAAINVPSLWSGMKVHIWAFLVGNTDFVDGEVETNKGMVSETIYVGTGDIA